MKHVIVVWKYISYKLYIYFSLTQVYPWCSLMGQKKKQIYVYVYKINKKKPISVN